VQIVATSECWSDTGIAVDQLLSVLRNVLFALVEGDQESPPALVVYPAIFISRVPLVMTEATDDIAVLGPNKGESVFDVVAHIVEGRRLEAML
jgi:hypothetical protein